MSTGTSISPRGRAESDRPPTRPTADTPDLRRLNDIAERLTARTLGTIFLLSGLACVTPTAPGPAPSPKLEQALEAKMEAAHVAGLSAAVVRDGRLAWAGAFGWADAATGRRVETETLFHIASVSKTVTAVVVLQQVERGLLDLDADLCDVLPFSVRHPQFPEVPITTRHLLTHTSGLKDNWNVMKDVWVSDTDFPAPLGECLYRYLDPAGKWYDAQEGFHDWAPGAQWKYSNVGVALAGFVAEFVAGKDFDALAQEGIFGPLGMQDSSYRLAGLPLDQVAAPHQWREGAQVRLGHHGYMDFPAGTLRTSAPALAKFLSAISQGGEHAGVRILQAETVREMLSVQTPDVNVRQGLAWYRTQVDGGQLLGHSGGDPGISTQMQFSPTGNYGYVLLMNGEPSRADKQELIRLLLEAASQP